MATHGIAIMSQRKGLEFETTIIESDTRNLNHIVKKILDKTGDQVRFSGIHPEVCRYRDE